MGTTIWSCCFANLWLQIWPRLSSKIQAKCCSHDFFLRWRNRTWMRAIFDLKTHPNSHMFSGSTGYESTKLWKTYQLHHPGMWDHYLKNQLISCCWKCQLSSFKGSLSGAKRGNFSFFLSSANEVTSHKEELNSRTAVSWGSCFIYGNIFGDLCISRDTVQYPMIAAGSPSNISPLLKCHVFYFSQCIGANTLNPKSPPCKKFNTSHYFIPPRQILDIQTTSRRHWRNNYDNRE